MDNEFDYLRIDKCYQLLNNLKNKKLDIKEKKLKKSVIKDIKKLENVDILISYIKNGYLDKIKRACIFNHYEEELKILESINSSNEKSKRKDLISLIRRNNEKRLKRDKKNKITSLILSSFILIFLFLALILYVFFKVSCLVIMWIGWELSSNPTSFNEWTNGACSGIPFF